MSSPVIPPIFIHFQEADEARMPIGCSKFGGFPDLPSGIDWPANQGELLGFFCQIRLADLPSPADRRGLPRNGMLWFFRDEQSWGLSLEEKSGWKVIYSSSESRLEARDEGDPVHSAHAIFFSASGNHEKPGQGLRGQLFGEQSFGYQLGDVRYQANCAHDGLPCEEEDAESWDPEREDIQNAAAQWQFLLQVDDGVSAMFFLIRNTDLESLAFDEVWFILQTS